LVLGPNEWGRRDINNITTESRALSKGIWIRTCLWIFHEQEEIFEERRKIKDNARAYFSSSEGRGMRTDPFFCKGTVYYSTIPDKSDLSRIYMILECNTLYR
jgi:hypothetical protein